jgi:nitrile hydratase accessory protein
LFAPEDPLAPKDAFDEPWQAQALAVADTLVQSGKIAATDWAEALGAALREAEAAGALDTSETYYTAVLTALERLSEPLGVSAEDRTSRRSAWEEAFHRTPHGQPVSLDRE